jgi:hypothetical protein
MFSEERQQIVVTDAPMSAGGPERGQQILLDPVDYRARVVYIVLAVAFDRSIECRTGG